MEEFAPTGRKFFPFRVDPLFFCSKFSVSRVDSFAEGARNAGKQLEVTKGTILVYVKQVTSGFGPFFHPRAM